MKKSEIIFNAILLPVDYLAIFLAALTAYFLRFSSLDSFRPVVYELPFSEFLKIATIASLGMVVISSLGKMYIMRSTRKILDELVRIFLLCSSGVMVVIVLIFLRRDLFSSRFIVLAAWVLSFIYVGFLRLVIIFFQRWLFGKGLGVHKVVLIGDDKTAEELFDVFSRSKTYGLRVVKRFFNFDQQVEEEIINLVKNKRIDEIILADPSVNKNTNLKLADLAQEYNLVFKYAADLFKTYAINVDVHTVSGIPIVELKRTPLDGWGRVAKRTLDIIFSFVFIIIISPVMLATVVAIKLDSKGPVFFARNPDGSKVRRVGRNGELFWYFKFRSMVVDAEKYRTDQEFLKQQEDVRNGSPLTKFKNDPRITKVGKFIRKYSIDELPEFFLVLTGKMSLVGPRPHLPDEVAKYAKHHKRVLSIKPGITGVAQVAGRSDLDFEEEVKLDIYYIENWSIRLYLYILFKTPFILFNKRQAL